MVRNTGRALKPRERQIHWPTDYLVHTQLNAVFNFSTLFYFIFYGNRDDLINALLRNEEQQQVKVLEQVDKQIFPCMQLDLTTACLLLSCR